MSGAPCFFVGFGPKVYLSCESPTVLPVFACGQLHMEVLPLSPLDGSIRIAYCLGSCQGPSALSPLSKTKSHVCFMKVRAW